MALIRIEDVFVAYGSPSRAVLAGIDLEIEEGSFVCLLGQTGCGKSTLLRLVLGSERPMRGPHPDRRQRASATRPLARLRSAEVLAVSR